MVSAFGDTEKPTSWGVNATELAYWMGDWVKTYDLDGIDIDYEDFNAVWSGDTTEWLIEFTQALRERLPQGEYLLSHAPVAPWFCPAGGSSYIEINNRVGDLIDWYSVQFYNQGDHYLDCNTLLWNSSGTYPGSSLFEIRDAGVDLDKLVIGKPSSPGEAYSGFIDTETLASCVKQAKDNGWNGGVMVWDYPDADKEWIKAVRAMSWPMETSRNSAEDAVTGGSDDEVIDDATDVVADDTTDEVVEHMVGEATDVTTDGVADNR